MPQAERQSDISKLQQMVAADAPIEEQLGAMRQLVHLHDRHLAEAIGISITTLRRWREEGTDDPSQGVENLRTVIEEIAATGQKEPRAIGAWLRSRSRPLGFERPIDLVGEANSETVRWIVEAGLAFALSYSLPESSPQGSAVPIDSPDLGGRLAGAPVPLGPPDDQD